MVVPRRKGGIEEGEGGRGPPNYPQPCPWAATEESISVASEVGQREYIPLAGKVIGYPPFHYS